MDEQTALNILSTLANGTDPTTGEVFPADSPYQTPNVIRALFVAVRVLGSGAQASPAATSRVEPVKPEKPAQPKPTHVINAGKSWTVDEDKALLAAFDASKSLSEIARMHQRTVGGVRARLEKHGRLEPSPATRWPTKSDANAVKESDVEYSI